MHLPDHFLDPTTTAATALLAGGAVTYSLVRLRSEAAAKVVPVVATSAVIFAAQMVNFPVASGTSGHVIGGALAGMLLGPWAGLLAMAAVLAVQAIVFGDGGVLALGANVLNMGVVAVWLGVVVDRLVRRSFAGQSRSSDSGHQRVGAVAIHGMSAALAGWLSVQAAALFCALEMAASGTFAAAEVVPAMLSIHAIIGVGEAAITALFIVAVISASLRATGGLWSGGANCLGRPVSPFGGWGFVLAAMIVGLSPFASTLPDGLERVAGTLRAKDQASVVTPEART